MRSVHQGKCSVRGMTQPVDGKCPNGTPTKLDPMTGKEYDEQCCDRTAELSTAPKPTGDVFFPLRLSDGTEVQLHLLALVLELRFRMILKQECPLAVRDPINNKVHHLTRFQVEKIEEAYKNAFGMEAGLCSAIMACNKQMG